MLGALQGAAPRSPKTEQLPRKALVWPGGGGCLLQEGLWAAKRREDGEHGAHLVGSAAGKAPRPSCSFLSAPDPGAFVHLTQGSSAHRCEHCGGAEETDKTDPLSVLPVLAFQRWEWFC